ncbi:hypothetical protein HYFRA_00002621 [Hymenoscyphus fraxineus]|uniref:Zn(2)-C6 fungal-type domain-containing protein n=1 Tax=Hymenoscyphus fraxineus TaxID=746836 RepID=A0A9N9L7V0_9HELO|nr:hypothetical protein HYFRA_00002621 [Hymenoscyphus fraxineus]
MRRPTSCAACRSRRRKCTILRAAESCTNCVNRGIPCVKEPPLGGYYHQHRYKFSSISNVDSEREDGNSHEVTRQHQLPAIPVRLGLVQLYFDYIHNQFHTIFHPPTFKSNVAEDRVPHVLLYSMFALSARFSTDPSLSHIEPRVRGAPYFDQAVKLLNIRDISLVTVQASILLGAACIADGDDASETVYYGVGCRIAQLLDLPNIPVSCILEHEINIRVWSSLCMVDVWSSSAVKLPKHMPNVEIQLPMDEMRYLALTMSPEPPESDMIQNSQSPLISEMIKLNRILLAINDFNESCVQDTPSGLILEHAIHGLSRTLNDWEKALPAGMKDTPENFQWHASHGLGRTFAAVYLGYYHFGQLLFYQFLHTSSYESTPSAALYAERCKEHAASLCEMIYRAFATPDSDVLYTMVAHVLVIASTACKPWESIYTFLVQIHTLLFSELESQIKMAHSRLERNFEILQHLRPYWSTLDRAMMRLRAFHDTCRKSMDTSFVLDRWMLKFLVEFAKPVEEKGVEEQSSPSSYWTLEGIASRRE